MELLIQEKIVKTGNLIDIICMPNLKALKQGEDPKLLFKRNRVLLSLHLLTATITTFYSLFSSISLHEPIHLHWAICSSELITFIALCRSYPQALNAFYFISIALLGPFTVYFESFSLVWMSMTIFPIFVLYTNGYVAYVLQIALQIIFLQIFYKHYLTTLIIHSNPVVFAERMIEVYLIGVTIHTAVLGITSSALNRANHQVKVHKEKQSQLELQKAFLLGFSHELRNITNSLLGNIQLALLEKASERVKCLLNSSEIFGGLLLHLINNTLDVGKVEVGELEVTPTSTAIYDALEKIWSLSAHLIKNRGLEGYMKVQNKLPQILKIDQYRLMQIIINLISNASKFTEKGTVSIDIQWVEGARCVNSKHFKPAPYDDTDEGIFEKDESFSVFDESQICVNLIHKKLGIRKTQSNNCQAKKGIMKIVVRDTGCGIDKEKLPKIFRRTSHQSLEDPLRRAGTKLSLYVTKCLVERMDGDIKAYSQLNKGTTFIVCLPLEVAQENNITTLSKEEVKRFIKSSNLKSLVVDDMQFNPLWTDYINSDISKISIFFLYFSPFPFFLQEKTQEVNRVILNTYLKNLGITNISEAKNGLEAFEVFTNNVNLETKQSFDIVTMDVEMPVVDGKKAVELIRKFESENNLRPCLIIMVSGNCSESEISGCLNSNKNTGLRNADFFLKKPASIDDLSDVITSWYQKKFSSKDI